MKPLRNSGEEKGGQVVLTHIKSENYVIGPALGARNDGFGRVGDSAGQRMLLRAPRRTEQ